MELALILVTSERATGVTNVREGDCQGDNCLTTNNNNNNVNNNYDNNRGEGKGGLNVEVGGGGGGEIEHGVTSTFFASSSDSFDSSSSSADKMKMMLMMEGEEGGGGDLSSTYLVSSTTATPLLSTITTKPISPSYTTTTTTTTPFSLFFHSSISTIPPSSYTSTTPFSLLFSSTSFSSSSFPSSASPAVYGTLAEWDAESRNLTTELPDVSFPTYMQGIYTTWCLVLLVVGLIGNTLVPVLVMRDRELRGAATSVFILNLVVADLLVLVVCLPALLSELYAPPSVWILPASMCKVVPYVEFTVAHASMLTIMAITVERYRAICHPIAAATTSCTATRAAVTCVLVWALATTLTSPVIALTEYTFVPYIDNSLAPVCYTRVDTLWPKVFVVTSMVMLFFLPLLVLVLLYWKIARQLLLEDKQLCKDKPNPNLQARKQVVVMLGTIVVVFFVCLLPYRVFSLWFIFITEETEKSVSKEVYFNLLYAFRVLVYLNSAINPILYNITSSKFRGAFYRLLGVQRGDHQLQHTGATATTTTTTTTSSRSSSSTGSSRTNTTTKVNNNSNSSSSSVRLNRNNSSTINGSNGLGKAWRSQRILTRCSYTCVHGEAERRPLMERRPGSPAVWGNANPAAPHDLSQSPSPAASPFLARSGSSRHNDVEEAESFV